jgi:hypothetical protein
MSMKPWCVLMSVTLLLCGGQQAKSATTSAADSGVQISTLENRFFCHTFSSESMEQRVQRLESFVFGRTTPGDTIGNRIDRIAANVPAQAARRSANSAAALTRQRQSFERANYPTVTQFEQDILKRTYESDPISARLDRLEMAQFGRTSNRPDLGLRMNNLKASLWPKHLMQTVQMRSPGPSFLGFESCKPAQPTQLTLVDKIEILEKNTCGKIYAGRPLEKRVEFLEKSVLGTDFIPANSALTPRVAQLWQRASLAELPQT